MPHTAIMALSFSFSKFSSSHSRGEATRRRAVSATHAVPRARQAAKTARSACNDGIGEPSSAKICGASCAKAVTMARQRSASAGLSAAIRLAVASIFRSTPSQPPSGNAVAKHCSAPTKARPWASKAILVGGKERRAGKQAQIHRIEVVAKAGPRDFAGLDRAAGNFRALDDGDLPALGGKMQRGGEPVDAGADHDRIVSHSLAPRCADPAGSPPSRSLASADISYLKCLR